MSATLTAPPAEAGPKARAILDAAGKLFLDEGYPAVSMDAVARRAGVSKATLYAHFESKETLFAAIVAAGCQRMTAEAEALADHDLGIEEGVARLAETVLGFLASPLATAMYRAVLAESRRAPGLAAAFYEAGPKAGLARMARWVEEEQRRGRLRAECDPAEVAGHFSALLRGDLWLRAGLGLGPAPDRAAVAAAAAQAAAVFLRAYGTGAGPAPEAAKG